MEDEFLSEWRRVYKNHLATFVAWKTENGYRYRCVMQHHVLGETSETPLTTDEVEERFKRRPELKEYFD